MREVLYEVDWQRLRISLLQARRNDGGWSGAAGLADNLDRLDKYMHEATGLELTFRKYRVNNCLNAVVMGYNGQGASAAFIKTVQSFRLAFAGSFDTYAIKRAANSWQWDVQLKKLIGLYQEDKDEFDFLEANLKHRAKNGNKMTRPELYKFLELMRTASRT